MTIKFELPKPDSKSVTLAWAKVQKLLYIFLAIINTVGISAVVSIVPEENQWWVVGILILVDTVAAFIGIDGSGKIAGERRLRQTVFSPRGQAGTDPDQALTGVFLDATQLERFKSLQPFVETGLDYILAQQMKERAPAEVLKVAQELGADQERERRLRESIRPNNSPPPTEPISRVFTNPDDAIEFDPFAELSHD